MNTLTPEIVQLASLIYYHRDLRSHLRDDIAAGSSAAAPGLGFSHAVVLRLLNKLEVADYLDAYKVAHDYHNRRVNELLAQWEQTLRYVNLDQVCEDLVHEFSAEEWVGNSTQLGDEPAAPFTPKETV